MGTYGILVSNTMVPLQESFTGFRSALCVWWMDFKSHVSFLDEVNTWLPYAP
jgi:hypothetical protein